MQEFIEWPINLPVNQPRLCNQPTNKYNTGKWNNKTNYTGLQNSIKLTD